MTKTTQAPESPTPQTAEDFRSLYPNLPEIDYERDYRPGMILALLPKIMEEVRAIGKDSVNAQQRFNYRSIDAVMGALHPLFAKHGVTMSVQVLESTYEKGVTANGGGNMRVCIRVQYRFYAMDGSYVTCVSIGEALDMADKASNKAMSAALKYALLQTFLVPTEDQPDADAQTIEVASEEQMAILRAEAAKAAIQPFRDRLKGMMANKPAEFKAQFKAQLQSAGNNPADWAMLFMEITHAIQNLTPEVEPQA